VTGQSAVQTPERLAQVRLALLLRGLGPEHGGETGSAHPLPQSERRQQTLDTEREGHLGSVDSQAERPEQLDAWGARDTDARPYG
jgi:hypothetical protein